MQVRYYLTVHAYAFAGTTTLKEGVAGSAVQVPFTNDVQTASWELCGLNGKVVQLSGSQVPTAAQLRTMAKSELAASSWTIPDEVPAVMMNSSLVGKRWEPCDENPPIGFVLHYESASPVENPVGEQSDNQVFAELVLVAQVEGAL